MNIFVTSTSPLICARNHCTIHRNKMIVEYAQLMCTAHSEWGTWVDNMYKPTHVNHPSAKWTRASKGNYQWLYQLWTGLLAEYAKDTGKIHKSARLIDMLNIHSQEQPRFSMSMLAMPEEYKTMDIVTAYRNYLNSKFAEWRTRAKPITIRFNHVPDWYRV